MSDVHVTGVCGSLREDSVTRVGLTTALAAAEGVGATTELLDLREWDLPVYDPDRDDAGDAERFRQRIRGADAVLLGSPMYHGSYSAPLKNAIDYCGFDELEHKTVGLLGVSGGNFPITTLEHLRSVCRALNCWVIPHQAAVPNSRSALDNGAFADDGTEKRIRTLGREAVQYANIEPDPATFESCENVGAGE